MFILFSNLFSDNTDTPLTKCLRCVCGRIGRGRRRVIPSCVILKSVNVIQMKTTITKATTQTSEIIDAINNWYFIVQILTNYSSLSRGRHLFNERQCWKYPKHWCSQDCKIITTYSSVSRNASSIGLLSWLVCWVCCWFVELVCWVC